MAITTTFTTCDEELSVYSYDGGNYEYYNPADCLVGDYTAGSQQDSKLGLHYTSIVIPPLATIISAHLDLTCSYTASTANCNTKFTGQKINNAPSINITHAQYDALARTTAYVNWTPGAWSSSTSYESPNIGSIIQEIVNMAGWTSGNSITICWDNNGSSTDNWRDIYLGATYATLTVKYASASTEILKAITKRLISPLSRRVKEIRVNKIIAKFVSALHPYRNYRESKTLYLIEKVSSILRIVGRTKYIYPELILISNLNRVFNLWLSNIASFIFVGKSAAEKVYILSTKIISNVVNSRERILSRSNIGQILLLQLKRRHFPDKEFNILIKNLIDLSSIYQKTRTFEILLRINGSNISKLLAFARAFVNNIYVNVNFLKNFGTERLFVKIIKLLKIFNFAFLRVRAITLSIITKVLFGGGFLSDIIGPLVVKIIYNKVKSIF